MLKYKIIPVTSLQQNCSLIWCEQTQDAALIDPGGDVELLLKAVDDNNVNLKAIYLTHGHLDHIGAADELRKKRHLPVIGPHKEDEFLFSAIPEQCEIFGFSAIDIFFPDEWLNEQQTINLGCEQLSVIHTPGHTPGHIVLKHEAQKLLWVGDVIFKHSIGRTDFPRGDFDILISSIKNKLFSLRENYRFVPGHGPESTLAEEKNHNPFLI